MDLFISGLHQSTAGALRYSETMKPAILKTDGANVTRNDELFWINVIFIKFDC